MGIWSVISELDDAAKIIYWKRIMLGSVSIMWTVIHWFSNEYNNWTGGTKGEF